MLRLERYTGDPAGSASEYGGRTEGEGDMAPVVRIVAILLLEFVATCVQKDVSGSELVFSTWLLMIHTSQLN